MNPRFAPAWTRFFHNADKDTSGGTTKPPTVAELTQRVTDLEAACKKATDEKAEAEKAKTDLEASNKTLADEKAALEKAKTDLEASNKQLAGEKSTAETARANAEAAQKIAETKANEAAAKAGFTPPFTTAVQDHAKGGATTMSIEAFRQLSPRAQRDYCLQGGKITE